MNENPNRAYMPRTDGRLNVGLNVGPNDLRGAAAGDAEPPRIGDITRAISHVGAMHGMVRALRERTQELGDRVLGFRGKGELVNPAKGIDRAEVERDAPDIVRLQQACAALEDELHRLGHECERLHQL